MDLREKWPVSIDGVRYLPDWSRFQRAQVPRFRQGVDDGLRPSSRSVSNEAVWRSAVYSAHHGMGQRFYDTETADPYRVELLENMRWWVPYALAPLGSRTAALTALTPPAGTPDFYDFRQGMVTIDGLRAHLIYGVDDVLNGGVRHLFDHHLDQDGTTRTNVEVTDDWSGGPFDAVRLADGAVHCYYTLGGSTIGRSVATTDGGGDVVWTDGGSFAALATVGGAGTRQNGWLLADERGFLLYCRNHHMVLIGSGGAELERWTLDYPTHKAVAAANGFYIAIGTDLPGHGGSHSQGGSYGTGLGGLYYQGIDTDGSLLAPVIAGFLPAGEAVQDVVHVAGALVVATSKGVRVATLNSDNTVSFSALLDLRSSLIDEANDEQWRCRLATNGRFVHILCNAFSVPGYYGGDSFAHAPALIRMDLATVIPDTAFEFAWALDSAQVFSSIGSWDGEFGHPAIAVSDGDIYCGMTTTNGPDKPGNAMVFSEETVDNADQARITIGAQYLGVHSDKWFLRWGVNTERSFEVFDAQVGWVDMTDRYVRGIGEASPAYNVDVSIRSDERTQPGETITAVWLEAIPAESGADSPPERLLVPVILHRHTGEGDRAQVLLDPLAEWETLSALRASREPVTVTIGNETLTCYVEDLQIAERQVTGEHRDATDRWLNAIVDVYLITVDT